MAGILTADEARAQVAAAHQKYMSSAYVAGAVAGPYVDNQARVTTANATHTAVANSSFGSLNFVTAYNGNGYPIGKVYTGGNIVTVAANRAGVDAMPEDTQNTEDLEVETVIEDALSIDKLFATGGIAPGPSAYYYANGSEFPTYTSLLTPYVDSTFLAEASKMTGEKLF